MAAHAAQSRKSLYSVHPGVKMVQDWAASLPGKTGRSLDEWVRLVKKSGPPTEKEQREWLKKEHGLGMNSAWWIAERAEGKATWEGDGDGYLASAAQYVEGMFSGKRAALRPIYDRLLKLGLAVGKEAKACPCRTIVPLYRHHVFAQIKPATNTRIDMGFSLGKMKTPKRLLSTGGLEKGDRITHRIPIESLDDVDEDVKRWLKTAYDLDA